ncbi:MAG: hypothetical protein Q9165_001735 [Trypethelium subeluteriae]
MPLKLFNKGDVDTPPSHKPPTRRLSKPRTISDSSRSPQKENDSPRSTHNSWMLEDEAVIEVSGGSHRSRSSTRDRLRSQLFSEKFLDNMPQDNRDEQVEDSKRRSWFESSASRLSLSSREPVASPTLTSPGGSKLSLPLPPDAEMDLPKAISIIQELKKNVSPEDLMLLHKALLPTKDEYSPVSASSDDVSPPLLALPTDRTIRRRSIQQAPGVATRLSPRPSPKTSSSEERMETEVSKRSSREHKEARSLSFPPAVPLHGRSISGGYKGQTSYDQSPGDARAATPSSQTDFGSLSTPGELRITNGAASPDSMRSVRRKQKLQRAELKAQKQETPSSQSREDSVPVSSIAQVPYHEDNGPLESLQASQRRPRLSRDEGYFTASDCTSSSKEVTPSAEDGKKSPPRGRQTSPDKSSLPTQSRNNSSPKSSRPKSGTGHSRTRSGSPFPMKIQDDIGGALGQSKAACSEDGSRLSRTFWLGSPSAEDYRREIRSNPYALTDESETPTPRASPPQDSVDSSSLADSYLKQQSRTPEEAFHQLNGSQNSQTGSLSEPVGRAVTTLSRPSKTTIQPQGDAKSGKDPRRIENRSMSDEQPRRSESSIKKGNGYSSEASSARQSKHNTQSKHNNPEAPRPIQGGTFGKPSPYPTLGSDFGTPVSHPPLAQGSTGGATVSQSVERYEVDAASLSQGTLSKAKSSSKLRPTAWFSRSSSSLAVHPPRNVSVESFATLNQSNQEPRKPKKLQKFRPKTMALAVAIEEDSNSSRPTSKGSKGATGSQENIVKTYANPTVSQGRPEHDLAEQTRGSASVGYSDQAMSQRPGEGVHEKSKRSFSLRSKKSLKTPSKKDNDHTDLSEAAAYSEKKISRRKSIFGRSRSLTSRSTSHNSSSRPSPHKSLFEKNDDKTGSDSEPEAWHQDFGTVAASLGVSPYDVAMSGKHAEKAAWDSRPCAGQASFPSHSHQAQQLMGQAMQPTGVPHPHQISNAHVRRPKSLFTMNEEQASEYARMRSKDRAEMLGKPKSLDPRDIPVSSGPARPKSVTAALKNQARPQSLYETYPGAPPVPALPQITSVGSGSTVEMKEDMTANNPKAFERSLSEGMFPSMQRISREETRAFDLPIEDPQQAEWRGKENRQKPRKERRRSTIRERGREHSQPPSPIKEEEGSPKSDNGTTQTRSEEDARRKGISAVSRTSYSASTLPATVARKSFEGTTLLKSPTQALETQLSNPPQHSPKYFPSSQEVTETTLSKEAEQGLKFYPEFAHLLSARASAKAKPPSSMTEYSSSNTTIDTIISPPPAASVSSAARVAHSQLSPLGTSNTSNISTPQQPNKDDTVPMPRRQIHPSARPRQTSSGYPSPAPSSAAPPPTARVPETPLHATHTASTPARSKTPNGPTSGSASLSQSRSGPRPTPTAGSLAPNLPPELVLHRYSGGLKYGWERGAGIGGSAGTREEGNRAGWKGVGDRASWGVDLGDVPVFVTGQ